MNPYRKVYRTRADRIMAISRHIQQNCMAASFANVGVTVDIADQNIDAESDVVTDQNADAESDVAASIADVGVTVDIADQNIDAESDVVADQNADAESDVAASIADVGVTVDIAHQNIDAESDMAAAHVEDDIDPSVADNVIHKCSDIESDRCGNNVSCIVSQSKSCSANSNVVVQTKNIVSNSTPRKRIVSTSYKLSPIKTAKGLAVKAAFMSRSSPVKRVKKRGVNTEECGSGKNCQDNVKQNRMDKVQTRASIAGLSPVMTGHPKTPTSIRKPQSKIKGSKPTIAGCAERLSKGQNKRISQVSKMPARNECKSVERLSKNAHSSREQWRGLQKFGDDHVSKKPTSIRGSLSKRKGSPVAGPSKRVCNAETKGIGQSQRRRGSSEGQRETVHDNLDQWSDVEMDNDDSVSKETDRGKTSGKNRCGNNVKRLYSRSAEQLQTTVTSKKKGPPCKGLLTHRKSKYRQINSDSHSDDDSDYIPDDEDLDVDDTVTKPTSKILTKVVKNSRERRQSSKSMMLLNKLQSNEDIADDCSASESEEENSSSDCRSEIENSSDFDDFSDKEMDKSTDKAATSVPQNWYPPIGQHHVFDCNYANAVDSNMCSEPIEFFRLFMDDELVDIMVSQTNLNAKQSLERTQLSAASRINSWTDINKEDMESFIGLLLWMRLVKMPSIKSYWRRSQLFRNSVAPLIMARNRFELILRMWHFADNSEANDDGRLHKIRNLVNLLVAKFQQAKVPGEHLVVDETMIPFRGRLKFRQYLPGKSHKYGVKVFKLCDRSGYTYNLDIYSGKGDGQATEVVMKLSEPYLDAGRTMCTDNYYTSLPLADCLLSKKTHLVGTVRSNRKGLPKEVTDARMKKGEVTAGIPAP